VLLSCVSKWKVEGDERSVKSEVDRRRLDRVESSTRGGG
jgi:hypothetical protein